MILHPGMLIIGNAPASIGIHLLPGFLQGFEMQGFG